MRGVAPSARNLSTDRGRVDRSQEQRESVLPAFLAAHFLFHEGPLTDMLIKRSVVQVQSEFYSKEFGVERSHGTHMKGVLEYISYTAGHDKRYDPSPDPSIDDVLERYASCGFIWEHVMTREMVEIHRLRQQSQMMDIGELFWCYHCNITMQGGNIGRDHCNARRHRGIFASPDGVRMDPWHTLEFKFTWKSSSRVGDDHINGIWMWPNQTMGYSHLLDTRGAELYAMFAVGDYRDRGRPEPRAYRFDMTFDRRETARVWDMIVVNAIDCGSLEV